MFKHDNITFTHKTILNIYNVYKISDWNHRYDDYLTLVNSLFGAVKLTKNANGDKYKHSGYGIKFDRRGTFSFPIGVCGCN